MTRKLSIIVPTYNGAAKLPYLLKSLSEQTFKDFEIVIVVDGSTDSSVEVIEEYRSQFSEMKIIVQENAGRSKVRNRGVKEATGDLLIFYDDDMVMAMDSVQRHINFHNSISRPVLLAGGQKEILHPNTDIQRYKAFLTDKWLSKYTTSIIQLNLSNLFFSAANCSMPKEVFSALNGFDARLTDAEDYDFGYRAIKANIPVFFDKENVGEHRELISCIGYIKRQRMYRLAHQRMRALHRDIHMLPESKKSILKSIVYRSVANAWMPSMIDKHFFTWLPKAWRFKLYDITIQALAVEYPNVIL